MKKRRVTCKTGPASQVAYIMIPPIASVPPEVRSILLPRRPCKFFVVGHSVRLEFQFTSLPAGFSTAEWHWVRTIRDEDYVLCLDALVSDLGCVLRNCAIHSG